MTTTQYRFTACRPRPCCPKTRTPTVWLGTRSLRTCFASQAVASCPPRQQLFLCISRRCRSGFICTSLSANLMHKPASHFRRHKTLNSSYQSSGTCNLSLSQSVLGVRQHWVLPQHVHAQALQQQTSAVNLVWLICYKLLVHTCELAALLQLRHAVCTCRGLLWGSRAPKCSACITTACRPWRCRSLLPCKAILQLRTGTTHTRHAQHSQP